MKTDRYALALRALQDPAVSKARHDMGNRQCSLRLSVQLLERVRDPAKQEALIKKILNELDGFRDAIDTYIKAFGAALEKLCQEEDEEEDKEDCSFLVLHHHGLVGTPA